MRHVSPAIRDVLSSSLMRHFLRNSILAAISMVILVPWAPRDMRMLSFDHLSVDMGFILMLPISFLEGVRYGREAVFTYGPWGFVASTCGPFNLIPLIWLIRSAMAAIAVLALVGIVREYSSHKLMRLWAVTGAVVIIWFWLTGQMEAFLIFPAIFIAWKFLWLAKGSVEHDGIVFGLIASCMFGLIGLLKCEFLIFGLLLQCALLLSAIRPRPVLLMSAGWAGAVLIGWLGAGQHILDFPRWLFLSCEMMLGYSDAMAKPFWEPIGQATTGYFYIGALATAAAIAALAAANRRVRSRIGFLAFMAAAVVFSIKHAISGNQIQQGGAVMLVQLWLLGLLALDEPRGRSFAHPGRVTSAALILAGVCFLAIALGRAGFPLFGIGYVKGHLAGNLRTLGNMVIWRFEEPRAHWGKIMDEIRQNMPAPAWLSGTADIYPQHTGVLIAAPNLEYRPRPVYLTFAAYTRKLLQVNADHLRGGNAPENILFQILPRYRSINNRHPATADGPSWPELLSRYRPIGYEDDFLLLKKRDVPKGCSFVDPRNYRADWEEPVRLGIEGLVWGRISIRKTFLGRIFSFLYKSPHIEIEVVRSTGDISTFQLVPELGETGFLISPLVVDTGAFTSLYFLNRPEYMDILGKVESVVLRSPKAPKWFWSKNIEIEVSRLKIDEAIEKGQPASLRRILVYKTISKGVKHCLATPTIDTIPGETYPNLLFHAPCGAEIDMPAGIKQVRIRYGIRYDAKAQSAVRTDGAGFEFFALKKGDGKARLLRGDWLDPANNIRDRQERVADLALNADESAIRIVTLTGPQGDPNLDHTYISDLEFLTAKD